MTTQQQNIWKQDLDKCTLSSEGFQAVFPTIFSKIQENNQTYRDTFFKYIPSLITSKEPINIQRFHALYLLFKVSEKKDASFASLFAKNEELLSYLYKSAQYDATKKGSFDERGKTFFSKKPSRTEAVLGMNFLRLCHETLLNWKNLFGNKDSSSPCHSFYIYGDFTSKQMKQCTYFYFIGRDYDLSQNLATWEFHYGLPKTFIEITTPKNNGFETIFSPIRPKPIEEHNLFFNRSVSSQQFPTENLQKETNFFRQETKEESPELPILTKSTTMPCFGSDLPTILNRRAHSDLKTEEEELKKSIIKSNPNLKLDFPSEIRRESFTQKSSTPSCRIASDLSAIGGAIQKSRENVSTPVSPSDYSLHKQANLGFGIGFNSKPKVHSYNLLDKRTTNTPPMETGSMKSARSIESTSKNKNNIIVFADEDQDELQQQQPRGNYKKFTFGPIGDKPVAASSYSAFVSPRKDSTHSNTSVGLSKQVSEPPKIERGITKWKSENSIGYGDPKYGLKEREDRMTKMFDDYAAKLRKNQDSANAMYSHSTHSVASFGTLPTEQDDPKFARSQSNLILKQDYSLTGTKLERVVSAPYHEYFMQPAGGSPRFKSQI